MTATTVSPTDKALYFSAAISVFFIILLTAIMVIFVFKYRRKNHPVAGGPTSNIWLEITWTTVPTLLALAMFYYGIVSYNVALEPPQSAPEITVIAHMWAYDFKYPNNKLSPILYLPVGRPVNLNLESRDVIHGFYIPSFRVKQDVVPGRTNHISFTPLETGTYDIFCTQYCGKGHSDMHAKVVVLPPRDYYVWLRSHPPQPPVNVKDEIRATPDKIAAGKVIFDSQCAICHGPDGKGEGLPGARNFTTLQGWTNGPKLTQMFRTVTDGLGQMPSFSNLTVTDRFNVIHYEQSLAKGQPPDTPAEIAKLDKDYNLSKGGGGRPEIEISLAMQKLSSERTTATIVAGPVLSQESFRALQQKHPLGAEIYARNCASCHGTEGQGGNRFVTLSELQSSRASSPSLNAAGRAWQKEGVEGFRESIRRASVSTGGIKPSFSTLSKEEWNDLYQFVLALAPPSPQPMEGMHHH